MWIIAFNFYATAFNATCMLILNQAINRVQHSRRTQLAFILTNSLCMGTILNVFGNINNDKTIAFFFIFLLNTILMLGMRPLRAFLFVLISYIVAAVFEIVAYFTLVQALGFSVEMIHASFWLMNISTGINGAGILVTSILVRKYTPWSGEVGTTKWKQIMLSIYLSIILSLALVNFVATQNASSMQELVVVNNVVMGSFLVSGIVFVIVNHQLDLRSLENRQLRNYIETIDQLTSELREFQHNYRNVLQGLMGYIESQQWQGLREYFTELVAETRQLSASKALSLRKIKEPALFGLVSDKLHRAESSDVVMLLEVYGEIGPAIVRPRDLCEVVGVFIDNAIEAAATSEKPEVLLQIWQDSKALQIVVSNRFEVAPDLAKIYEKGYSQKGERRGLGLYLAKKCLERYPQVLHSTIIEGDSFKQDLVIPVQK